MDAQNISGRDEILGKDTSLLSEECQQFFRDVLRLISISPTLKDSGHPINDALLTDTIFRCIFECLKSFRGRNLSKETPLFSSSSNVSI